jgi:uncharacterized protein YecE (DUF72 family)
MQILAGTSGFSYAEWRGRFYPDGLPGDQMLRFYSERLPSVEINNTFYRMPKPEMLAGWGDGAPADFSFALKATRRITHQQRLADVESDVRHFFAVAGALGNKLGPVLFQLPPFLKKDVGLLRAFLPLVPAGKRAAFEFRHSSWFSDDVYVALAERNAAFVGGDLEESEKSPPLVATADFGYLRLRRLDYDPPSIADWGARIAAQTWQAVYAYFKHEALGPMFAEALLASISGQPMADLSAVRASIAAPSKPSKSPKPRASKAPGVSQSSQVPSSRASKVPGSNKPSKVPSSSKPSKVPSSSKPSKVPSSSKPSKVPSSKKR